MKTEGTIFDISRFCINDGPGIRTTVFFKGCPLRCLWCHNPESQSVDPQIMFSAGRCTGCGHCVRICPRGCHLVTEGHEYRRKDCIACGACANECPGDSLRRVGRTVTVEEVLSEVRRDCLFYEESGGGLTVSGGEPLMQPAFLESLLSAARAAGIHTCVETCGYAPQAAMKKIAPLVDCFLFDYKESDPERHRVFTGVYPDRILKNLRMLDEMGAYIILRLPLIPGYNDTESHIAGIAATANRHKSIRKMEIMPYHPLGISKADELGVAAGNCCPTMPDNELLDRVVAEIRARTDVPVEISK